MPLSLTPSGDSKQKGSGWRGRRSQKWHVYDVAGSFQILSDIDLAKIDERRVAYTPIKLRFDAEPDAMAYMVTIAGKGRAVNR